MADHLVAQRGNADAPAYLQPIDYHPRRQARLAGARRTLDRQVRVVGARRHQHHQVADRAIRAVAIDALLGHRLAHAADGIAQHSVLNRGRRDQGRRMRRNGSLTPPKNDRARDVVDFMYLSGGLLRSGVDRRHPH